ncbi:MAG: ABC transporter ATP-binding protein [Bacteroidetes bacterium]|nr:MAG: ABC transporter ATP-binding protein [Bacteroidota bacterium]
MQEGPLLDVEHRSVRFGSESGETLAVDDISFSIQRREILGIVGESGSGKSVTALSLLGLIPDPPGRVTAEAIWFWDGSGRKIRLDTLPEKELRNIRGRSISMIFQEPMTSLNPVFSCGNQVSETMRQHLGISGKEARTRVLELFREVRLPDPPRIFRAYPHELSGGQKQRVMIAMAISCNPSLLIADEPTTALDVSVQKTILDLLKRLRENRHMSILFITHDLGLIHRFADRVLVMYRGKIVEQGEVRQLFEDPQHPYTRGLIACRPPKDKRLERLPTVEDYLMDEGRGTKDESTGSRVEGRGSRNQDQRSRSEKREARSEKRKAKSEKRNGTIVYPESRIAYHEELYSREPVLKVEHVGKVFASGSGLFVRNREIIRAVDNVSFLLYPGETLGIVGESGCGKTTLSRAILQLIPPSEGRIIYGNEDITTITRSNLKALRKELQIIFQDPYSSLNPRITIGEAIREPMEVHHLFGSKRQQIERVNRLLEMVGLSRDQFRRYPHEFSGGQRQRICIARALAVEPRLIICDESVSALDISIQAQILNLLNDLKHELQLTYIFISHDLNVVKYMADRLIVMKEGRIVEMGDPDEIYVNPKSEYTKVLLEAMAD